MQEVEFEVRQMTGQEILKTRLRSGRQSSLRNKMAVMNYGEYIVVPPEVFSHAALRQAVHRFSRVLARGRYRCMKDKESGELRVLYLGE